MMLAMPPSGKVFMRLEALRSPDEPGYEIALYRQETATVPTASLSEEESARPPKIVSMWVAVETIPSDRPSADKALEQVLGFLEMRCA
jgi:hypothetical protein